MKLISWNVNGLRACVGKGFMDFFNEVDADVFCIQESKLQEGQIDLDLPGYHQYWNYAEKKGYSGTGFFCRIEGLILSDAGEKNCVLLFLQRFLLWQYKDKDPHMPPLHLHPVAVMGSGRYSQ